MKNLTVNDYLDILHCINSKISELVTAGPSNNTSRYWKLNKKIQEAMNSKIDKKIKKT